MNLALATATTPLDEIRYRLTEASALIFDVDGTLA